MAVTHTTSSSISKLATYQRPINSSPLPFTTHSSSETVSPNPNIFFLPSLFMRPYLIGVYVTSIFVGAFAFGVGFDVAVSNFWDNWNRGVCPSFLLYIVIRRFNDCVPPLYAETMEGYST
jgi:hypothetical protein